MKCGLIRYTVTLYIFIVQRTWRNNTPNWEGVYIDKNVCKISQHLTNGLPLNFDINYTVKCNNANKTKRQTTVNQHWEQMKYTPTQFQGYLQDENKTWTTLFGEMCFSSTVVLLLPRQPLLLVIHNNRYISTGNCTTIRAGGWSSPLLSACRVGFMNLFYSNSISLPWSVQTLQLVDDSLIFLWILNFFHDTISCCIIEPV